MQVNKWLSEQAALLPEAAGLGADFLPRRRRPRVDPTLLDWKKLTGEENVSVINRLTGKKVCYLKNHVSVTKQCCLIPKL